MKKTGTAIMAILILTSVLAAPMAYAKKGQVTIRVTSSSGKGKTKKVVNTRVVLQIGGVSIGEEYTDEKGKAIFTELEPDTEYTIVVWGSDGWQYEYKFTTNKNGGAPQQNIIVN